jgi:hypothetical protein
MFPGDAEKVRESKKAIAQGKEDLENDSDHETNLLNIFLEISGLDPTTAKHYLQVTRRGDLSVGRQMTHTPSLLGSWLGC